MLQKLLISSLALSFALSYSLATKAYEQPEYLLPENFTVYVKDNIVINHPAKGFEPRILPTNNEYLANPGCYIACYSHIANNSVYGVSDHIYVNGQIRVNGAYQNRICKPTGFEYSDISTEQSFKDLCNTKIATCNDRSCWAGGDTGGWFGIQG